MEIIDGVTTPTFAALHSAITRHAHGTRKGGESDSLFGRSISMLSVRGNLVSLVLV